MRLQVLLSVILLGSVVGGTAAERNPTALPLYEKGAVTYYVAGRIDGYGETEFMVDTGSGYTAINEQTLDVLKQRGMARYVKDLRGIMADGSTRRVPVYEIASIQLGEHCVMRNVEAAVLPGSTRSILGMSTLKRTAPFSFSLEPPSLMLSGCDEHPV